jgi:hypothetical protein
LAITASRARSSEDAAAPWLAELEAERARAIAEANSASRRPRWIPVTVGFLLAGVGLGAMLGGIWALLLPVWCGLGAFILGLTWARWPSGTRAQLKERLAKIDEETADTKRTAAIALAASPRVRIAREHEADTLETEEEQSARRARSS